MSSYETPLVLGEKSMRFSRPAFVIGIVLSCSTIAFCQGPSGPPGMHPPGTGGPGFERGGPPGMPLLMLASQKAIQTELKLDQAQKDKIQTLDSTLRKSMGGPTGGPMGGPRPPRRDEQGDNARPEPPDSADRGDRPEPPDFQGADEKRGPANSSEKGPRQSPLGQDMRKQMTEAEKKLAEILSEKQLARLKQIALQLQGPRALLASEAAKKLELTEEQREKIRRLSRKNGKPLKTILTDQQWKQWQEMIGEPFKGKIALGPPGGSPPRN